MEQPPVRPKRDQTSWEEPPVVIEPSKVFSQNRVVVTRAAKSPEDLPFDEALDLVAGINSLDSA